MYPKKFSLSFIFLYLLCDISIFISLSLLLFPQLYETHILCLCSFFSPPFVAFSFAFSISVTVSVCVCVIYIISLLQKFTLIVGTIFWHFGFTTLRAVCVAVAVAVDVVVAVFDNFFVVVQPYVKLVSLFLTLSPSPPVCLSPPPHPQIPFQQPTAHFTSPAFGNMCAFRLSVCPFLFSVLSSLSCFY